MINLKLVHEHNLLKIMYSYAALIMRSRKATTNITVEAINEFNSIVKRTVGRNVLFVSVEHK